MHSPDQKTPPTVPAKSPDKRAPLHRVHSRGQVAGVGIKFEFHTTQLYCCVVYVYHTVEPIGKNKSGTNERLLLHRLGWAKFVPTRRRVLERLAIMTRGEPLASSTCSETAQVRVSSRQLEAMG